MKKKKLDLKETIETVALANDIKAELILETIINTIKVECADLLDISDDKIFVESDKDLKINIFIEKEIVEKESYDHLSFIALADISTFKLKGNVGESVKVPFYIEDLNRKSIKHLNYVILNKLKNIRKEIVYQDYKKKEGEIVTGTFLRKIDKNIIVSLPNSAEGMLHHKEQIFLEHFNYGDVIKCYIKSVSFNERNHLNIELSRKDPRFVLKLFYKEVKEMQNDVVKVKSIVREAGKKTKIAVYSTNSNVEPVGACVGLYGNRIKAIMKELKSERIDVIPYSEDTKEYIKKALEPGKAIQVLLINEKDKEALVIVEDESYPLAIGRYGLNVKLATSLVGWELSVRTREQMEKHPEILKIFSNIDNLFKNQEEDINQLTSINEELLVKLMHHGITTVAELYEKSINEISSIEGISREDAEKIKGTLQEMVEVVEADDEEEVFQDDIEDKIASEELQDNMTEEIQQVEYIVCPNCGYEFEYTGQDRCPKCGTEFEVE